ncbi:MAG: site-2 protease family protein [Candidatus Vogelbacteria bacterium]|nr:site-2 protease family protein [Candidatus Vogelbacteria bacterium]
MTIVIFLIILAVLILSHEFGHFLVAKFFGIRVDEFGFGFPPRILSLKNGETVYSINLLPLGGFVKIFGEDPIIEVLDKNHKDADRSLYRKPRYIQAAVVVAGVFFNLILAWLAMSFGFMAGLPLPEGFSTFGPDSATSKLLVTEVLPASPAQIAGLKPGENLVYLATKDSSVQNLSSGSVQRFIVAHGSEQIFVGYKEPIDSGLLVGIGMGPLDYRAETKVAIVTPKRGVVGDRPGIGISMDSVGIVKLPFFEAFHAGLLAVYSLFTSTASGLFRFILGFFVGTSLSASVSGPIGLIGVVGDAARFGIGYLLALTALISTNLAVLNLVPFPALDGGRLLFLLIESIIRRPLHPKIVNALNIAGFLFLLGLMMWVTYGDIRSLIKPI